MNQLRSSCRVVRINRLQPLKQQLRKQTTVAAATPQSGWGECLLGDAQSFSGLNLAQNLEATADLTNPLKARYQSTINHQIRDPIMTPRFWTGVPPIPYSDFTIDCSEYNLSAEGPFPAKLIQSMEETYEKVGLVVLANTGLTKLAAMKKIVGILLPEVMNYQGGANSRGALEENVFDTGAPASAHLHYHHEMAYVKKSVSRIAFCCTAHTPGVGATYVSDNVKATDMLLKTKFGQKLKEKGICYIRCLTDRECFKDAPKGWNGLDEHGVYNHWQRSFGVTDKAEVEFLANQRGLQVEWGPHNYCKTKYYVSAFEYFPQLDRNLLYSSVADDSVWFDTWPGVCELPTMDEFEMCTPNERPLKLTFGDDTDFTREEIQEYIDVYDECGLPINWNTGDIAVMCNWRWAHGRPHYELQPGQKRQLGVVLGKTFDRIGEVEGKW